MIRKPGALDLLLLIAIIAVLVFQSLYIFYYPQIDTGMWFGDESWTVLTLREVARTGVARIPEAIGSSIAQSNGLVNGVVWLSGLVYGVPTLIFSHTSPVWVGRVVTLVLSLALVVSLYALSRKVGANRTATIAALLVMVASPVFYFSSHSARLDVITALAVVVSLYVFIHLIERRTLRWYVIAGTVVALSLAIYVHVPTLTVLPWLFALWWSRSRARALTSSFLGAGAIGVLLIAIYFSTVGNVHLLGSGHNQYYSVASALPILHPFSWQVQRINTILRFIQVWDTQWPVIVLLLLGAGGLVFRWSSVTAIQRALVAMCVLVVIGWMLFEGPAVFYEIHATPAFALIAVLGLSRIPVRPLVLGLASILFTALAMYGQREYGEAGRILSLNNQGALRSMLARVRGTNAPIVLADQPAWNIVAAEPGMQLMTSHLLLFGGEQGSVPDILRAHNVQYLLLYSTTHFQSPFRTIADTMYSVMDMRTGDLTDEAKDYDPRSWRVPDTVRLYRAKWLQ